MAGSIAPKIVTNGLVLYLDASNGRSYPGSTSHYKPNLLFVARKFC